MKTRNSPAVDLALVICGGIITATASLSAITALMESTEWVPVALAVVSALTGAVQVSLRAWVQGQVTPTEDVVEVAERDLVVAGPANEQVTEGEVVRVR